MTHMKQTTTDGGDSFGSSVGSGRTEKLTLTLTHSLTHLLAHSLAHTRSLTHPLSQLEHQAASCAILIFHSIKQERQKLKTTHAQILLFQYKHT